MVTARRTRSGGSPQNGGTSSPTAVVRGPLTRATQHLKHKRRYCRIEGCNRIVKSQGLCQRHGAKPKTCSVEGCTKQAQGNFDKMCKAHFKAMKRETTPIPKVVIGDAPPKPEGKTVYAEILPRAIAFDATAAAMAGEERKGSRLGINPLVAHLKHGFDSLKPPAWHRNEERKARGVVQVENPATQLTGWERELVWMEILILTGVPGASFRHLARAWGRDKGFHMVLAQFVCERHGDVQRKKRLGEDTDGEGPVDPGVVARRPPKKRKPRRRSARRVTSGRGGKGGNDGTTEDDTDTDDWDPSFYGDVDMLEAIFDFNEDDMPKQNQAEDGNVSSSSSSADLERKAAMKCLLGDGDSNGVVNGMKVPAQPFTEASQGANRGRPKIPPMQKPNNQVTNAPVPGPSHAPQQQMHQGQSDQQVYNPVQAPASQQHQTHQPYQEIANHGLYALAAAPAHPHRPIKQEPVDQMAFAPAPAPHEQNQHFDPNSQVVYANAEAQSAYANAQAAHIHQQQQQLQQREQHHTDQVVYMNARRHQMPQQPHGAPNLHHHHHQFPPASQQEQDNGSQVVYAGVQSPHQLPEAPPAQFHRHPPLQQQISFNAQVQSQLQQLPAADDGLAQRQQRFLQEHPGEPVPSDAILRRLFNVGPPVAPPVPPPAPPPVVPHVLAQEYQRYQYQQSVYRDPPAHQQMAQQPEIYQQQQHQHQEHKQPQETIEYHQQTSRQVNPLAEPQQLDSMQLQHQAPTVQFKHEQEQHPVDESAMMEAPDALEVHHAMHIEESNPENNSASQWT